METNLAENRKYLFSQITCPFPCYWEHEGGFQGVVVVLYLDLGVDCVG